jgi:hypothetical protein
MLDSSTWLDVILSLLAVVLYEKYTIHFFYVMATGNEELRS